MNLLATGPEPADRSDLRPLVTFTLVALPVGWVLLSIPLVTGLPLSPFIRVGYQAHHHRIHRGWLWRQPAGVVLDAGSLGEDARAALLRARENPGTVPRHGRRPARRPVGRTSVGVP